MPLIASRTVKLEGSCTVKADLACDSPIVTLLATSPKYVYSLQVIAPSGPNDSACSLVQLTSLFEDRSHQNTLYTSWCP